MRKLLFLFTLAFATNAGTVYAADGSSGCGPGWYIFKENSLLSSALRATTNGMLFPVVTIGMTFGTSNCTRHKLVLKEKESLYFATQNHFELKTDMAKGSGEYLNAFAATVGCPARALPRLSGKLRANFKRTYFPAEVNPEKTVIETFKVILSDPDLTRQCSLS